MVYRLKLNIGNKTNEFVRNGEPNLRNVTDALKTQAHQLQMYDRDNGPTEKDFDTNERLLALFAVNFWNNQFTSEDVINGVSVKDLKNITNAIDNTLKINEVDDESEKNSQSATSKKQ